MAESKRSTATSADAQPFNELAAELKLPLSTLHLLRARGKGPRTFRLGRHVYVSKQAKQEWIAALDAGGAA